MLWMDGCVGVCSGGVLPCSDDTRAFFFLEVRSLHRTGSSLPADVPDEVIGRLSLKSRFHSAAEITEAASKA